MCLFVCLLVSLSVPSYISKTTHPNLTKFFEHVTSGRGLVLWCVLSFYWMASCFYIMRPVGQNQARRYVSSSSPGGGTGGEVWCLQSWCSSCLVAPAACGPAASVKQDAGVLAASPGGAAGIQAEAVAAAADRGWSQVGRPSPAAVPAWPCRAGTLVQCYQPPGRPGASCAHLLPRSVICLSFSIGNTTVATIFWQLYMSTCVTWHYCCTTIWFDSPLWYSLLVWFNLKTSVLRPVF